MLLTLFHILLHASNNLFKAFSTTRKFIIYDHFTNIYLIYIIPILRFMKCTFLKNCFTHPLYYTKNIYNDVFFASSFLIFFKFLFIFFKRIFISIPPIIFFHIFFFIRYFSIFISSLFFQSFPIFHIFTMIRFFGLNQSVSLYLWLYPYLCTKNNFYNHFL